MGMVTNGNSGPSRKNGQWRIELTGFGFDHDGLGLMEDTGRGGIQHIARNKGLEIWTTSTQIREALFLYFYEITALHIFVVTSEVLHS